MAAWYLVRCDLRRRWAGALLLGVAVGLAAAMVLAGVAGARRGPAAFDDFVNGYGQAEAAVFAADPARVDALEAWAEGSELVDRSTTVAFVVAAEILPSGEPRLGGLGGLMTLGGARDIEAATFVEGRAPEAPDELAIDESLAEHRGLGLGDQMEIALYGAEQLDQVAIGTDHEPAHGIETFTVTGIQRAPLDLAFEGEAQPGTVYENEGDDVQWSGALWDRHEGDLASYGAGVGLDLRDGVGRQELVEEVNQAFDGEAITEWGPSEDFGPTRQVIDLQAGALLVAALIAAAVTGVIALQALGRQLSGLGVLSPVLPAVGVDRGLRAWAAALWGLAMAVPMVVVAIGGASVASLVTPIGVAARAEFGHGMDLDLLVVLGGALGLAGLLVGGAALRGWRGGSPRRPAPRRPSPVADALVRAGAGPASVTGASLTSGVSQERGRVPARTGVLTVGFALTGVLAAVVFWSSLHAVITEPAAFGWTWDVAVANCGAPPCSLAAAERLAANDDLVAYTGITEAAGRVDGEDTALGVYAVDGGWAGGEVLDGRPPIEGDEVVLAEGTQDDLGVAIGDEVLISVEGGPEAPFRVVGTHVPPAMYLDEQTLRDGVGLTWAGAERAAPPALVEEYAAMSNKFLVRFDPATDRDEALARLRSDFPRTVVGPVRTDEVEGMARLGRLPVLLAGFLGVLGLASLVHLAVATARRRRGTVATLNALGGSRRLGRRTLAWSALVVAIGGVAVGLPSGVVVGRLGWLIAAEAIDVGADPVTPVVLVLVLALATVGVAAALGWSSGLVLGRRPGPDLRTAS